VFLEALVSITSGMLLWMGFWDLLEIIVPPDACWRVIMIAIGVLGLLVTRTMYDVSLVARVRQQRAHAEHATSSLVSNMELGSVAASDGAVPAGAIQKCASTSTNGCCTPASTNTHEAPMATHGIASSRPYFDAPPIKAQRCGSAVFATLIGLTLWVGLWDLVDYHIVPALFTGINGTYVCTDAEADPGPWHIVRTPACLGVKLLLMLIGVVGLWATRSLYGSRRRPEAQFSRCE